MPEIIWKQGAESDLLQIFAELEERSEARYKICPRITPINANESKIDFLFRVHSRDSWALRIISLLPTLDSACDC
jgi:hypothetical protein